MNATGKNIFDNCVLAPFAVATIATFVRLWEIICERVIRYIPSFFPSLLPSPLPPPPLMISGTSSLTRLLPSQRGFPTWSALAITRGTSPIQGEDLNIVL